MMDMEISGEYSCCNDQTIVKGKRTKRPRLSSSTSSSGGGYGGDFNNSVIVSSSSPTTSSGISTSTEEDEDMANCLILLASSGGFSDEAKPPEIKFSSRKFTEMATTTNGKIGIYVYECKTCSRTFPSFQALGGHRASHKKPKITADSDAAKKSPPPAAPIHDREDNEELPGGKFTKLNTTITSPPSTQLGNRNCHGDQIKPKIHECSICGSEFASGQALGGHMRRHRSAIANTRNGNNDATTSSHDDQKTRNVLVLDLNLPAPPEDDRREMKFHAFSSSPPPRLVFSAAALVDCHY